MTQARTTLANTKNDLLLNTLTNIQSALYKYYLAEDLKEKFSKSKVVIVTDYQGLNVTTLNMLRRKLREAEIDYRVVKNSLLVRASQDTDVATISEYFKGPSAVAISYDDPTKTATFARRKTTSASAAREWMW